MWPPFTYNNVKQLLQTQTGLIFMKYKYRCKSSCFVKSMPFLTRWFKWEPALPTVSRDLPAFPLHTDSQLRFRICPWIQQSSQLGMICTHMAQSAASTSPSSNADVSEHCSEFCNPGNGSHPASWSILMINNRDQNLLLAHKVSNILNYSSI